jgi:mono/diheme cytochrome c family protein
MRFHKGNTVFFTVLGTFCIIGCISHYSTTTETTKAQDLNDSFSRGKNLAFLICAQCHYNEKEKRFIGREISELPGIIGKVYSSNLTHSKTDGILEKYTDAELAYLLKTCVNRDGKYIPWMPRPNMADTDINDLTIYFRSNDTAVWATDKIAGKTDMNIIGKMGTKVAGKPFKYRKGIIAPKMADSVNYGRYLVDQLACYHCHSKSVAGLDYLDPEKSKGYMQGGYKFKLANGKKVTSANLTPDDETGIGKFTKYDFRKAVKQGVLPNKDSLRFPMPRFEHLTNKQSDAIYAYLQTLMPKKNKIKR